MSACMTVVYSAGIVACSHAKIRMKDSVEGMFSSIDFSLVVPASLELEYAYVLSLSEYMSQLFVTVSFCGDGYVICTKAKNWMNAVVGVVH